MKYYAVLVTKEELAAVKTYFSKRNIYFEVSYYNERLRYISYKTTEEGKIRFMNFTRETFGW